jgi:hypothetical protein
MGGKLGGGRGGRDLGGGAPQQNGNAAHPSQTRMPEELHAHVRAAASRNPPVPRGTRTTSCDGLARASWREGPCRGCGCRSWAGGQRPAQQGVQGCRCGLTAPAKSCAGATVSTCEGQGCCCGAGLGRTTTWAPAWRQAPCAHRGPASRSASAIRPCSAPGPLLWTETLAGLAIGGMEGGFGRSGLGCGSESKGSPPILTGCVAHRDVVHKGVLPQPIERLWC